MFKLNYKGDLDDQIGNVMGPNLFNEYLQVTSQMYDPNENKTTLELRVYIDNRD